MSKRSTQCYHNNYYVTSVADIDLVNQYTLELNTNSYLPHKQKILPTVIRIA